MGNWYLLNGNNINDVEFNGNQIEYLLMMMVNLYLLWFIGYNDGIIIDLERIMGIYLWK